MTYYSEYIHQKNQKDKRNITLSKQKETQVDKYIRYRNAGTTTCILSTFSMKCGSSLGRLSFLIFHILVQSLMD